MSIEPQIIQRQEKLLRTIAKLASDEEPRTRAKLENFLQDNSFDLNFHVSGVSPLSKAISLSDNSILTLLLQSGRVNVDFCNDKGRTALSYAAQRQDASCVQTLMEHGADYDLRDKTGRSPLSWASAPPGRTLGDYKMVINHLASKGADMNSEDDKKFTPLTWATVKGLQGVVSHLLSFDAVNVDCQDAQGCTPLLHAVNLQNSTIARLLIDSRAGVNLSNNDNLTPLMCAVIHGDENIVHDLLASGKVYIDYQDAQGCTPLLYMVKLQHFIIARLLINSGADVNLSDKDGPTPLMYAAMHGYQDIAHDLLASGRACMDCQDAQGCTSLLHAVEFQHSIITALLTTSGADVNLSDKDDLTPLMYAAMHGYKAITHDLLTSGRFCVDCLNAQGCTPLLKAVKLQKSIITHLLIDFGADVNLSDKDGLTPLMYAAMRGYQDIAHYLLASGRACVDCQDCHQRTPLSNAVERGHEYLAKLLIESGANINRRDDQGRTPLTLAAIRGHYSIAAHLLSIASVKIDPQDVDKRTPLSYAAESGHARIVRLLVGSGADVNSQDAHGRIPLDLAMMKCHQDIVLDLVSNTNIDPNRRDRNERTPLSYAAELGFDQVAKCLLARGANANMEDAENRTPLLWATVREQCDLVARLLAVDNVIVDHPDINNRTALSYAAEAGNHGLVEMLMDAGADATYPNKEGHSCMWLLLKARHSQQPLPRMRKNFHFSIAERLSNPDFQDQSGRTLISWAAEYGDVGFVYALLKSGADVNIQSQEPTCGYPRTAIIWALQNGHERVIEPLKERDTGSLHLILNESRIIGEEEALKLVRGLLHAGYNIEQGDVEGKRPLHIASGLHNPDFATTLVLAEASLEARDNVNKTPLHYALEGRNESIVKVLLEKGARPESIEPAYWFKFRPGTHIQLTRRGASYYHSFKPSTAQNDLDWIPHSKEYRLCLHRSGDTSWSKLSSEVGGHATTNYICYSYLGRAGTSDCSLVSHLSVSFPCKSDDTWIRAKSTLGIEWGVRTLPKGAGYGFVSTLPTCKIPESIPDFISMFLCHLQEAWEGLCAEAIRDVENIQNNQLERQGRSRVLIDRLARNARQRTELRRCLQQHIDGLRRAVHSDPAVDVDKKPLLAEAINNIHDSVLKRLDEIEALVRELLQIELAWASINEAGSIKRLSWITFIFLPLMFVSSLFGMNIDLLKDSPDWKWCLLFQGLSLVLTASIWSLLKYFPIESWLEERRFMRDRKRMSPAV